MRCRTSYDGIGNGHSSKSGPGTGSGTETVKRPSAEQDVNFAAKRDAQGCEPDRFGVSAALGWTKMNVVGWLVIDAGDKEVAALLLY